MKVVLVAVNATYSHSNLALRYLSAYCGGHFPALETVEYNINQEPDLILADLARRRLMWWAFLVISGILN